LLRSLRMTIEEPLCGVVAVRCRESIGILFRSDALPISEVEGNVYQRAS